MFLGDIYLCTKFLANTGQKAFHSPIHSGLFRPQRATITAKPFLKPSACSPTIEANLPVMVTGLPIREMSD
jgi:hypothetical protein